jgi:hypothetical protein
MLKGRTVCQAEQHVDVVHKELPKLILEHYQDVTLSMDIMFNERFIFLITLSQGIRFCTAQMILDQKNSTILRVMEQVKNVYAKRGFRITTILMDGQFEHLKTKLTGMGITANTTSRDEHVSEIDQEIRMIKEQVRCVLCSLPFKRIPTRMMIKLVYYSVFWLNSFPASDGVSNTISLQEIVIGTKLDYGKHCCLEFRDMNSTIIGCQQGQQAL